MKRLLLLLFILSSLSSYSQVLIEKDLTNPPTWKKFFLEKRLNPGIIPNPSKTSTPNYVFKLENGSTLSELPMDRMPCIIPDISQFNMPVVRPKIFQGATPICDGRGWNWNRRPPIPPISRKLVPFPTPTTDYSL